MADERAPDHTEDPRDQQTGQGYPETNPAGSSPVEGTEEGPEAGAPVRGGGRNAPSPSTEKETDRAKSTGNPNAAG